MKRKLVTKLIEFNRYVPKPIIWLQRPNIGFQGQFVFIGFRPAARLLRKKGATPVGIKLKKNLENETHNL